MTPEQLKEHLQAPTQTALAELLGKPISTVAEWFQRGKVPKAVQFEVEIMTGGKLKADRDEASRPS